MHNEHINSKTEILTTDKLLRKVMFDVYDGRCFYTGQQVKFTDFDIDHILPLSKDGRNCIENYVLSSHRINNKKNTKTNEDFVKVISEVNKLLFVDKVVNQYNMTKYNNLVLDSMVDITTFIKEKGFAHNPKKQNFSYFIQRKLPIVREHFITTTGKKSRKCKLFVDKEQIEQEFKKYEW